MRILVTAGPTREFLDPVRYLTNRSTGTLGYAIAARAAGRGHRVALISGPVALDPPAGVELAPIVSAAELACEALERLADVDAVFMTAAVADFTPARPAASKIKKIGRPVTIELVPTADVLAEMGRRKRPGQVLVGFSLETERGEEEAARKLAAKNCDFLVLNTPANFGEVAVDVTVLAAAGPRRQFRGLSKPELADRLLDLVEGRAGGAG